ncbi:MAG: Nitroreductase [Bacteroidetes bacterium 38_7]|nr:MAG: Nitroreductase [Bacteroidetes bacterium 38_7]
MMSFLDLVKTRHSTRHFEDRPVEREKLENCLEAARLAPSASNSQPWTFIVVDDPKLKEEVARETYSPLVSFNKFVLKAGAIVVIVIEKSKMITQIGETIRKKEFPLIDIGIAAEHFCLQAQEERLGTCILGWFNEAPIKNLLHIPQSKTIGLLIAVGYPANETPKEKKRKPMDEFRKYNTYR